MPTPSGISRSILFYPNLCLLFLIRPVVERFKNGAPSKRESQIRVAEMQPAFHLHAQRNAFRRRDVRRQ